MRPSSLEPLESRIAPATISIAPQSVTEGDTAGPTGKTFEFVVSLNEAVADAPVTVHYDLVAGTALAGTHFQAGSGTATFAAGQTSTTIAVKIFGDTAVNVDRDFSVQLSSPSANATLGTALAKTTILDDDVQVKFSGPTGVRNITEGNSGVTPVSFTITLSAAADHPIAVPFTLVDGTATLAGGDFQSTGATSVTFAKGETTKTFTVGVVGDTAAGPDEQFQVKLSDPTQGLAKLSTTASDIARTINIVNDDGTAATPTITVKSAAGVEGGNANFVVSLSAASESPVTVKYATADRTGVGAATAAVDYTATSGTLTITSGVTRTISVPLTRDAILEGTESFLFKLSDATGATLDPVLATTPATGTIDDIGVGLKVSNVTVLEGAEGNSTAIFTLTLDKPAGSTVVLGYDTVALTSNPALSPGANAASPTGTHADFTPITGGSLTFAPNETTKTISVQILGDTVLEANEQFGLRVSTATITDAANTTAVPAKLTGTLTGVGTIQNDEGNNLTASITAQAATVAEGDITNPVANNQAHFTVELSSLFSEEVKVTYTVIKDGVPTDAFITIPAYTKTGTIDVTFTQDDVVKTDQQIAVTLNAITVTGSPVPNASFSIPAATKTARTAVLEDDAFVRVLTTFVDGKAEGTGAASSYPFRVELVDAANQPVTLQHDVSVNFATVDGTGANGAVSTSAAADFTAINRAVTVTAGQSVAVVNVAINPDNLGGVDEVFSVKISNPQGVALKTATAGGKILDDDGGATVPKLSQVVGNPGTEGGTTDLAFKLSRASDSPVTFSYTTTVLTGAGAAVQGDFTATTGTATIASGETSITIAVPIVQEAVGAEQNEGQERFGFKLSNLSSTAAFAAGGTDLTVEGLIAASDQPTLSVENVSAFEGKSGDTTFTFVVKLSAATDVDVVFDLQTFDVTATAGVDYTASSLTAQKIAAHQLTKSFSITVKGDELTEADEVFGVRIANIVNALSATPTVPATPTSATTFEALGTIKNDDSVFSIVSTNTDAKVAEGAGSATFKISRTGDINLPATVTYTTADGPVGTGGATSAGTAPDFTAVTRTITFAAGVRDLNITVPVLNDDRHEADQGFSVKLTDGTNGLVSTDAALSAATVTIIDNDAVPTVLVATPAALPETDLGTSVMNFVISLSRPNDQASVVVRYSTIDGSAKAGQDYVARTESVTFAPGETSKVVSVVVNNDVISDSAKLETFQLKLELDTPSGSSPAAVFAGGASTVSATGTIIDNEAAPVLSITAATITEGGSSSLVATLSHPSEQAVTFKYYTSDGTALAGRDFTGIDATAPQLLTIPAFQQSVVIPVVTTSDTLVEGSENFSVTLKNPVGAVLSPLHATAKVTIADDDAAFLTINDLTIQEGDAGTKDAIFTVSLIGTTTTPVTVDFATLGGTASAGLDFTSTTGTLTLGGTGGASSAQVVVKVLGDLAKESSETFSVKLSHPTVATLIKDTGTGTISDNGDTLAGLTISNGTVVEGSTGGAATKVKFTATLDAANTTQDVTFKFSTAEIARIANGAQAGKDFAAVQDQVVTIAKNTTSVDFFVNVVQDDVFEMVEFFNVKVSSVVNATVVNDVAVGTIHDDDLYRTAKLAKWTDDDGDVVTLAVTKGNLLTNALFFKGSNSVITINPATGGRILTELDLAQAGQKFFGSDITIKSVQQPDLAGVLTGDGRVNVGYIKANNLEDAPTALEVAGVDLGNVSIDGDLSRINVGDLFDNKGLNSLKVYSLSAKSNLTDPVQPDSSGNAVLYVSNLLAGANSIKVTTDVRGSLTASGLAAGSIGKLTIGGTLQGGDAASSGRINVTGTLGEAIIGNIAGGAGTLSGSLVGIIANSVLGKITVTGNITGGSGVQSGSLVSPVIKTLSVGGSLHGSANGGLIVANRALGDVVIQGDFDQNAQIITAGLKNNLAINKVVVHGNVSNARILAGFTYSQTNSDSANPTYGPAASNADAQINLVQVDGSVANFDIAAGAFPGSSTSFSTGVIDQPALYSKIARVVLNGTITANTSAHFITAQQIDSIIVAGQTRVPTAAGTQVSTGSNFIARLVTLPTT